MKKILVLGAGRSSYALIQYLIKHTGEYDWELTIGDQHKATILDKLENGQAQYASLRLIEFDLMDEIQRNTEVERADIVISLLPPSYHILVAKACLTYGKDLVTASYVSPEMKALDAEAKAKGLLFLNEIGLDPGLDHLSAMQVIDQIRASGATMLNFESFAGGLLSPESEKGNPWKYKFTWNPRNVVLAGQGIVKFIQEGRYKYIPYHRLFKRTEIIEIEGFGKFEGYANRDSLKYLDVYNLRGIPTIYRGTLRRPGFCRAWNVFVQLGATDDNYIMEDTEDMTYRDFINSFLKYEPVEPVELKLMHYLQLEQDNDIMEKLEWLGIFDETKIGLTNVTPAQILQHILEQKWTLTQEDRDMIVMWHQFIYTLGGVTTKKTTSMVVLGESTKNTAMSKTVGLPLGIATKLILNHQLKATGVLIPTTSNIYEPVLKELEGLGIQFQSKYQGLS
jgi:saccharopine dehydrogenase-like NADP-dependent oxidoreductase